MTSQALQALRESIAHWREVVTSPTTQRVGPDDCALCKLFIYTSPLSCYGCPVSTHTGRSGCRDTPYVDFYDAICDWEEVPSKKKLALLSPLAQAELDFLISLLPEGVGDGS